MPVIYTKDVTNLPNNWCPLVYFEYFLKQLMDFDNLVVRKQVIFLQSVDSYV